MLTDVRAVTQQPAATALGVLLVPEVRQAGARPGAGALLMPLQQEGWDKVLSVSRALSLTQARPTGLG